MTKTNPALDSKHVSFFKTHGYITFDEFIQEKTAKELKIKLDKALGEKLDTDPEALGKKPLIDLFTAAYDLELESEHLAKFLRKHKLANIAKQLFQTEVLRFGFSQYLVTTSDNTPPFKENLPFEQSCCLSSLAGLLLINLGEAHGLLASHSLSQEMGSALFLNPSTPFPWEEIFSMPGSRMLLIGFGKENTRLKEGTNDPLAYTLKKLGYFPNDPLTEPLHPLLK